MNFSKTNKEVNDEILCFVKTEERSRVGATGNDRVHERRPGKARMSKRARHDRVCNSCRRPGCYSDSCNCGVQGKNTGPLERNFKWHQRALRKHKVCNFGASCTVRSNEREDRSLRKKIKSQSGQSTVGFAIVAAILIVIVVAFIAILHRLDNGTFLEHAQTASSHNITSSVSGAIDAFSY